MEDLKKLFGKYNTLVLDQYKPLWLRVKIESADLVAVALDLQKEGLRALVTVSPTDFIDEERIEMNYFFEDLERKINCWIKCDIPREVEKCEIESLTPYFPGANWNEREAYSMFGVKFLNHPDLRPIIVSQDFYDKAPFRKDFDWDTHEAETLKNVQTIVDHFKAEQEENEKHLDPHGSEVILNWGPTHPASGPIRLKVHCDGEDIISIDPDIGFVWREPWSIW